MSTCSLGLLENDPIAGKTFYGDASDCIVPTGIYLPPVHTDSTKDLNVILFLHGWDVTSPRNLFSPPKTKKPEDSIDLTLRQSVLASGKDVVLVAPHLGYKWGKQVPNPKKPGTTMTEVHGSLALGKLASQGISTYLTTLLGGLENSLNVTGLTVKSLVLACHSGGGDLMRQATGVLGDDLKKKLKECWGYDCMYASGHEYGCWADSLAGVYFYFYLAAGSYSSYFIDFWKFAYGTPKQPEKQRMNNVFLAPALKDPPLESLTDLEVFQSTESIDQKTTPLTPYEKFREAVDPLLDAPQDWAKAVGPKLKGHWQSVRDLFAPRIKGLFASKPSSSNVLTQVRQSVCHPDPPKSVRKKKQSAAKKH